MTQTLNCAYGSCVAFIEVPDDADAAVLSAARWRTDGDGAYCRDHAVLAGGS